MGELKAIEDQIALRRGNHQLYVLLLIWITLGGGILSYYEMKSFDTEQPKTTIENMEIKNPEAVTPG
jgi:hypothetical protein